MFNIKKHSEIVLKKSTFGHFFVRGRVVCAYNALKIITVYFDEKLYRYILLTTKNSIQSVLDLVPESSKKNFINVLTKICNAHILVPQNYQEIDYLTQIQNLFIEKPAIRVLVLHLTDFCNLCCRYCFIEGNIPKTYCRKNMDEKVLVATIDKFGKMIRNRSFSKTPSIVFYGGEPLINWDVMRYGLEYVAQKQRSGLLSKNIEKVLITNGTLITPDIATVLKKHKLNVSISIDGPKNIHDLNRIDKNGIGSFKNSIKGFKILKKYGVQPAVSCVLGKESLGKERNIARWLFDELGVKALGFNHVSIVPGVSYYDPKYENGFGDALLNVQDLIQSDHPDVYERRMNHKINNFLDKKLIRADCTGCGEQMSVSPDGKIGICQGYMGSRKTFSGDVFNKKYNPENDPVFIEWSRRSPLTMKQCFNCSALATCGGGCPRNADFIHGSIWEVDSAFCHFAKKAQEWMIWKKFEEEKNN